MWCIKLYLSALWLCFLAASFYGFLLFFYDIYNGLIKKKINYYLKYDQPLIFFYKNDNIDIIDMAGVFYVYIKKYKLYGIIMLVFSFIIINQIFFIFIFLFLFNLFRFILTITINIDNNLTISMDYFQYSEKDGPSSDNFFSINHLIKINIKNIWFLSKFFSNFIMYALFKKFKNSNITIEPEIFKKISINFCLGMPWYLFFLSIKHAEFFISNKMKSKQKKKIKIKIILFVKNFFIKNNIFFFTLNQNFFYYSIKSKIYIDYYKIKINGITDLAIKHSNHLDTLSVPYVWEMTIDKFGKNFTVKHQILTNANLTMGAIFTRSQNVYINGKIFNTYWFSQLAYNPTHKQHVLFSFLNIQHLLNQQQNQVYHGILESIWKNHNLSNVENYIGWKLKTNLMLALHHPDNIPLQGQGILSDYINLNGRTHYLPTMANILAQQNTNADFWQNKNYIWKMKTISSFKEWYRITNDNHTENLLKIASIPNSLIFEQINNIQDPNIMIAINNLRNEHINIIINPNQHIVRE